MTGRTRPRCRRAGTSRPLATAATTSPRVLLEIVADKTGYPADMLELDMRLDTDLGIDSIKRVEIFSAIQDRLPESRPAGPNNSGPWARSVRSSPSWVLPPSRSRTRRLAGSSHR